jgi:hypothetical protein
VRSRAEGGTEQMSTARADAVFMLANLSLSAVTSAVLPCSVFAVGAGREGALVWQTNLLQATPGTS